MPEGQEKVHHRTDHNENYIIPIMGPVGAGKSTLINKLLGMEALKVGHSLTCCTTDLQPVEIPEDVIREHLPHWKLASRGRGNLIIVDTPGFDDTSTDNAEIMKRIADWLASKYGAGVKLAGLIYLQDISQQRVAETTNRDFRFFDKLCGGNACMSTVLGTTKWWSGSAIDHRMAVERERKLIDQTWNLMIKKGAIVQRVHDENPWDLVERILWEGKTHTLLRHMDIAPNAILNAGGRADETRCHPGTRQEVVSRIDNWRTDAQNGVTPRGIFWLSAPAGAGKTAIVQTVAESWKSRGVHAANFFFFRTDPTRNNANSLVLTLLYQILEFYHAGHWKCERIIQAASQLEPDILTASVIKQFDTLICSSLRYTVQSFSQPIVLLIDGLDECIAKDSQQQVLRALDVLLSQKDLPFLVLIASRVEPEIKMTFKELKATVTLMFLGSKFSPSDDIWLFVTAEFDRIKRTHHLAPEDEDWPLPSDIDGIVAKSSGQFIFAATAMRFMSESAADPKLSLAQIQGTAPIPDTESPFAALDSMYTHILCQSKDQEALKDILHVALIMRTPTNKVFNGMVYRVLNTYNRGYTESVIETCVSDVVSLIHLQRRELVFHHASFDDYLQNRSRSGEYFVDLATFSPKILPAIWEHIGKAQGVQFGLEFAPGGVESMLPDLMNTIIDLESADFGPFSNAQEMKAAFRIIYSMCVTKDTVATYKQMIRNWITHYITLIPPDSRDKTLCGIPCSKRYILMAEIDCAHDIMAPTTAVRYILPPSSPCDVRETSSWIRRLLRRIHRNYYHHDPIRYKRLMEQWIFFAIANDIPLTRLGSLPYAQQYIWRCTIHKSPNTLSNFVDYIMILYHMLLATLIVTV